LKPPSVSPQSNAGELNFERLMENLRKPPYSEERQYVPSPRSADHSIHISLLVLNVFPLISRRNVARYSAAIVPKLGLLNEAAGSGGAKKRGQISIVKIARGKAYACSKMRGREAKASKSCEKHSQRGISRRGRATTLDQVVAALTTTFCWIAPARQLESLRLARVLTYTGVCPNPESR
jgi:hypothetical protein